MCHNKPDKYYISIVENQKNNDLRIVLAFKACCKAKVFELSNSACFGTRYHPDMFTIFKITKQEYTDFETRAV